MIGDLRVLRKVLAPSLPLRADAQAISISQRRSNLG